jgi:RimJ/RimL family protein N-acetyltransferase
MQSSYDFVLTEIATRNTRSIRAHEKVGFQLLHRFSDEKEQWDIVVWDWS